ncbi:MAG: rhodanese-like domain-containing protein [Candidatus Hodarchaeales archaeon]|jgi:rhodanese-related sulfurtransferase
MDNEGKVKEKKASKLKMGLKFIRLFFYRVIKRKWYLPTTSEITVDHLFDRINAGFSPLILDHRPAAEFDGPGENAYMTVFGHIQNSKSMGILELSSNLKDLQSFMELVTDLEDLQSFKEKEIVTICPGGGMSLISVDIMSEVGFTDVKSLKGGIVEWNKKGYPLLFTTSESNPSEELN